MQIEEAEGFMTFIIHGSAHSREQMRIIGSDRLLRREIKRPYKSFAQLSQEIQRSA